MPPVTIFAVGIMEKSGQDRKWVPATLVTLSHERVKIQFFGEVCCCLLSFLRAADNCFGLHSPEIFFQEYR